MERYVMREPRVRAADCPQESQMISYATNTVNPRNMVLYNNVLLCHSPETMYFGGYGAEFPVQRGQGYMAVTHVNAQPFTPNMAGSSQIVSGIDPRYLAAYADTNASFIAGQRQLLKRDQNTVVPSNGQAFANDYENRDFIGADRSRLQTFTSQRAPNSSTTMMPPTPPSSNYEPPKSAPAILNRNVNSGTPNQHLRKSPLTPSPAFPAAKITVNEAVPKNITQVPMKTRGDKLQELHKSGARAFSGPVEKVLKWHKVLQDIGVLVLYEIVAKCVSVRPGDACAKILVVRDDNGPAIQVVYYEIDFLLPDLKPPCMVRVVGRMMVGTCRLQAFSVRAASGDDVATLPRRAAVAVHHVSKICKEYGRA